MSFWVLERRWADFISIYTKNARRIGTTFCNEQKHLFIINKNREKLEFKWACGVKMNEKMSKLNEQPWTMAGKGSKLNSNISFLFYFVINRAAIYFNLQMRWAWSGAAQVNDINLMFLLKDTFHKRTVVQTQTYYHQFPKQICFAFNFSDATKYTRIEHAF